jgi:rRNA-processing protein FCF1
MSKQTPNADALRFAAEWLRQYDDSHDGGQDMAIAEAVAEWLDDQANAKELRQVAREHRVPVGKLRERLCVNADAIPGIDRAKEPT